MKYGRGIIIFGITEIAIGSVTMASLIISLILGKSAKPAEVLIFVFITSSISLALGVGILKRNLASYNLLIFFAMVIILSKLLIFSKIITLSGALDTSIPSPVKNGVSIIYHILLIWFFTRAGTRSCFKERRSVFFSIPRPFLKKT